MQKIGKKIISEAKLKQCDLIHIKGPIVSSRTEAYVLIRKGLTVQKLIKQLKDFLEKESSNSRVKRIIYSESANEMTNYCDYPLEVQTKVYSNKKEIWTTSDEFRFKGIYYSFSGNDSLSLAWKHVQSNLKLGNKDIKRLMIASIDNLVWC